MGGRNGDFCFDFLKKIQIIKSIMVDIQCMKEKKRIIYLLKKCLIFRL